MVVNLADAFGREVCHLVEKYDLHGGVTPAVPLPMLLWCPECGDRHVDVGEFETKPHHTHACQHCGHVWRPALINTVGVQFLPGYKNVVTT